MTWKIIERSPDAVPFASELGSEWSRLESQARRYLFGFPGNERQWLTELRRLEDDFRQSAETVGNLALTRFWVIVNELGNQRAIPRSDYIRLAQEFELWPHVEFANGCDWEYCPHGWPKGIWNPNDPTADEKFHTRPAVSKLPPDPWFGVGSDKHRIDL